jgi:hypothetical protein
VAHRLAPFLQHFTSFAWTFASPIGASPLGEFPIETADTFHFGASGWSLDHICCGFPAQGSRRAGLRQEANLAFCPNPKSPRGDAPMGEDSRSRRDVR